MYGEDWISIFKRIVRILKVKWWVYNKHHKSNCRKEILKDESILSTKSDYVSYVEHCESLGWKTDLEIQKKYLIMGGAILAGTSLLHSDFLRIEKVKNEKINR